MLSEIRSSHVTNLNKVDNDELWNRIQEDPILLAQAEKIFQSKDCDCGPSMLAFTGAYRRLAEIIPPYWNVYDCGCAYAFQSLYFQDHNSYVGIDMLATLDQRIITENSRHYHCSIEDFFK